MKSEGRASKEEEEKGYMNVGKSREDTEPRSTPYFSSCASKLLGTVR